MEARVKAFLTKVEYMVEGETTSDAITRLASEKGGVLGLSWDAGLDDADCDVIAYLLHGGALAQLQTTLNLEDNFITDAGLTTLSQSFSDGALPQIQLLGLVIGQRFGRG